MISIPLDHEKYGRGLPFPSPRDLSDTGIEPMSPALEMESLLLSHQRSPGEMESYSSSSKRIKKDYQTEPSGILQSHMSFQK